MKPLTFRIALVSTAAAAALFPGVGQAQTPGLCLGEPASIVGTSGDDVISGTPGNDIIAGLGGNDTVDAGTGNDVVCGDEGNDTLRGGADTTIFDGGLGDDLLDGSGGIDSLVIYAGASGPVAVNLLGPVGPGVPSGNATGAHGIDTFFGTVTGIVGSSFDDMLNGSSLDDFIDGGGGNDRILAGNGSDLLDGGPGNDHVDGQGDVDLISYLFAPRGVKVHLGRQSGTGWGTDRLVGIEKAEGSRYADVLTGTARANSLWGLGGNDRLNGLGGADRLFGNAGRDRLDGGLGRDFGNGGPGLNTCINVERRRRCPAAR